MRYPFSKYMWDFGIMIAMIVSGNLVADAKTGIEFALLTACGLKLVDISETLNEILFLNKKKD